MNDLIKTGRKRTIQISLSILLVSIHTIYFYHAGRPEIETKKLVQQSVRFLLTVGLLIGVYRGLKWAKIVSMILFSLAILGSSIGAVIIDVPFPNRIPMIVMFIVFSLALYHVGFSKSYNAFCDYQNGRIAGSEAPG